MITVAEGKEPRELTKAERQAVDRLEKALAAIPDSLALYFNEGGLGIFDIADWPDGECLAHRDIACTYDTGAL